MREEQKQQQQGTLFFFVPYLNLNQDFKGLKGIPKQFGKCCCSPYTRSHAKLTPLVSKTGWGGLGHFWKRSKILLLLLGWLPC